MQPKFVAAQKMLLKQKPSKHSLNGLLGFITWAFILRWKRVCIAHNNYGTPIDMGSSVYCSLYTSWVPSSCFCIVIQPLSEVK